MAAGVSGGGGGGDAINAVFRRTSRPPMKGVAILMPACNPRALLHDGFIRIYLPFLIQSSAGKHDT